MKDLFATVYADLRRIASGYLRALPTRRFRRRRSFTSCSSASSIGTSSSGTTAMSFSPAGSASSPVPGRRRSISATTPFPILSGKSETALSPSSGQLWRTSGRLPPIKPRSSGSLPRSPRGQPLQVSPGLPPHQRRFSPPQAVTLIGLTLLPSARRRPAQTWRPAPACASRGGAARLLPRWKTEMISQPVTTASTITPPAEGSPRRSRCGC
jgi:hypothetical protein